ncbi:hypothetical protein MGMO_17c00170 [Methyloglobulus morosus KoM1]|uniref:Uncharacterized protein n=1 Tax=Methyloglobulus morosus KoM1 TaxID=1116472 RepID=V5C516_9GAMM|nr:hypothetical protein MGMO_17c00170 [Methyloglobulus morosus KoM1]
MNVHGIRAIYHFEMARTFRTSITAPILTTSLHFIVFGKVILYSNQSVNWVLSCKPTHTH